MLVNYTKLFGIIRTNKKTHRGELELGLSTQYPVVENNTLGPNFIIYEMLLYLWSPNMSTI